MNVLLCTLTNADIASSLRILQVRTLLAANVSNDDFSRDIMLQRLVCGALESSYCNIKLQVLSTCAAFFFYYFALSCTP